MIIAVNARLNKKIQPEGYQAFWLSMLGQLACQFPQQQFLYIFNEPVHSEQFFFKNVQTVIAGPKAGSSLRLQYWLNFKLPAVLKKYKAGVFVSLDGTCPLRTKTPQCLLISDTGFLQANPYSPKWVSRFYKKNTAAFLNKAASVAAISEQVKKAITSNYKIPAHQITVVRPVIEGIFKPLDWEHQENVKEKYAAGKAYFLCTANGNLINLLKAFTFFKKRQRSSMQLLIAGRPDDFFLAEFKLYKLRNEVILLGDVPLAELAAITAAAYAVVHPVLHDDIALPALQALQCGVPLVCADTGGLPRLLGEAAIYTDPANVEDMAQKMMQVFKDEDEAKQLIKAGHMLMKQYQPAKTAAALMDCILKAANG